MSGDLADNWFGMEKPKAPDVIPPGKAPTLDDAAESQVATDRTRFRKGRGSTRLGGSFGTSKPAGFRLLGASS